MTDNVRGVYRKYEVKRTDGSSEPGGKHAECSYFVLDLEHDEFAIPALRAYAKACRKQYPQLAADIGAIVDAPSARCSCREAFCPHSLGQSFMPDGPSGMAAKLIHENSKGRKP